MEDPRERLQQRLAAVGRCPRPAVTVLARALDERYERAFAEVGVTTSQFTLLSAIGFVGEAPITTLTRYVARDQTTLSRSVDKLRQLGWVEVTRPPDNKRIHLVRLSDEGQQRLAAAMDAWDRARAELDALIGADEVDGITAAAWRAVKALQGG